MLPGQPDLKITTKPAERKGFTDLTIEQTQDYLFSFDIELQLKNQKDPDWSKFLYQKELQERLSGIDNIT